jgi:hypothetical protein
MPTVVNVPRTLLAQVWILQHHVMLFLLLLLLLLLQANLP